MHVLPKFEWKYEGYPRSEKDYKTEKFVMIEMQLYSQLSMPSVNFSS